ncbi:MAG: metallophosphoesterase family protein, partial [Acidobacteria bacterium]|nr:metallophosphoesterase family protein [Acidobacteriota bacterium]
IDALDAVLADAQRHAYDTVLFLGDLVGYGADPIGAIERVRQLPSLVSVRGNHDKAASGLGDAEGFSVVARASAQWTSSLLTEDARAFLAGLPRGPLDVNDVLEICHGTPFDEDAYVFDEMDALYAIQASQRPLCLFGHTHSPLVMSFDGSEMVALPLVPGQALILPDDRRYLVNVGSVGQPRDNDPRAAYGVLDVDRRELTYCRVEYPIARAQARIREAGLPEALAQRLAIGR